MNHKSVSSFLGTGSYTELLILSSILSTLFVFSGVCVGWAKAPEAEKIAFVSKRDGNAEIYIMNPDGTEQVNLTQHPAEDYDPAWAPDGKQILFSSDRTGDTFDLYLMDADGKNVQKVFKNNDIGELFLQLYKIDIKGGNPTQLTTEGNNSSPDWFNPNAFAISPSVRSITTTWGQLKQH